ncbi:MAG TPA: flagellar hook-associated protein FlgK [Acidimicrobiales bacterium]|nr:flagellar hook-associated protein FlgK [Acidimicrobiales bacterium]
MDQALGIAASSLNAQRAAMDVVSENLANAQTPGYLTETAELSALPSGADNVGSGVEVTSVAQARAALLAANNWQAQASSSSLGALQQVLTGVNGLFPLGSVGATSTTAPINNGLSGQLADFWSSWDGLAQNPSALAGRTEVVNQAVGLVTSLHTLSGQLSQMATTASATLSDQVTQLNSDLAQAAQINQSIVEARGSGSDVNSLEDQLNAIVGRLAQTAGVGVHPQADGTDVVAVGGVTLVQGNQAATVAVSTAGGVTSLTTNGGSVTLPVSSGSVSGLLSALNQYLPSYQTQLDAVANDLTSTVNGQLALGYTASGVSGSTDPLFGGSGATGITVNPAVVADPTLLAAATTTGPAAANDGSNAQAMAELGTVPTGPDAAYQNLLSAVGTDTQSVNQQVSVQTSVADQASQALNGTVGVNQDTELTHLMASQQIFEASSKLVGVVDAAMQALLSAV